jgi:prolipoprotein diacylglyceryl transferase
LYHVITDNYRYFGEGKNPLDALRIWDGGLGIWGAIALGGVGAWIACRRRGIPLPAMADALAPGIVIAQAVGRLGNYFNQELYGGPTDLPWGLEIFHRVNPDTGFADPLGGIAVAGAPPVSVVHPTFLYELLWNLGVALLVIWADRRFRLGHGRAFALYVAGYTAGRFWIEIMRTDDATQVLGMRVNVWVSALVFIGAVVYLVLAKSRGPREAPETLRGTAVEPAPDTTDEAAEPEPTADKDDVDQDAAGKGDEVKNDAAKGDEVTATAEPATPDADEVPEPETAGPGKAAT